MTPRCLQRGGRAFVFGDEIDTDLLAPGYLMSRPIAEMARHCLEAVDADFAGQVEPGDFVVAGCNFGLGSSREQAAMVLKILGISAVIAVSFGRIFYRNSMNIGLPAIPLPYAGEIRTGDRLMVDAAAGTVGNLTQGRHYEVSPIPDHLLSIIEDGGLMPHLKKRLALSRPLSSVS